MSARATLIIITPSRFSSLKGVMQITCMKIRLKNNFFLKLYFNYALCIVIKWAKSVATPGLRACAGWMEFGSNVRRILQILRVWTA